jgi:hypothetical protein
MKEKATYEYKVFKEEAFIFARYVGSFNIEEMLFAMELIWNDPNYRTDIHGLIDMRKAELIGKLSDIKHFMKILIASPKRTNARIAILVQEDRTTGFVMTLVHLVGSLMRIELYQLPENAIRYVGRDIEFFNYLQKSQLHKHVFENRGGVV